MLLRDGSQRASRRLQKHHLVQKQFDGPHVWDKLGLSDYLVDLVCFVYLVDLVHRVSFVQPKNQTDQTNQTDQIDQTDRTDQMNKTGWRTFSAS